MIKECLLIRLFSITKKNKDYFDEILYDVETEHTQRRGQSTERILIEILKPLKNEKSFKDEEHHLRNKLLRAFEDGIVARMRAKAIKKELDKEKTTDALKY